MLEFKYLPNPKQIRTFKNNWGLRMVHIWSLTIAGSLNMLPAIVSDYIGTLFKNWAIVSDHDREQPWTIVSDYMRTHFINSAIERRNLPTMHLYISWLAYLFMLYIVFCLLLCYWTPYTAWLNLLLLDKYKKVNAWKTELSKFGLKYMHLRPSKQGSRTSELRTEDGSRVRHIATTEHNTLWLIKELRNVLEFTGGLIDSSVIPAIRRSWAIICEPARTQTTSIEDCVSVKGATPCGVPKRSVLGPLLFLISINEIHACS